jgi:hypothetical protein
MPEHDRDRRTPSLAERLAGVRAIVGALILAVAGFFAWLRPRHRATPSLEEIERREHAALVARLRRLGHEPNDVDVGAIVGIGVLLAVVLIASFLGLWGLFKVFATAPPQGVASDPRNAPLQQAGALPTATVPPLPARLPVRPTDAQGLATQDEEQLHSYGWVDRQSGIVHIPIDRAIDLIVERGLATPGGR